ncbi:MAG TPA: aminoglycoside phosphotransferase family protein [Phototrophicaceae bacterium]|nr:aminoglycoside phosphotransferase family protein [Phototrophicaceae bacterium]
MLEKPTLPDDVIVITLRDEYDINVTRLEFLPVGNDATAWVYRVTDIDGQLWFLKVRKGAVYPPVLHVPRYLKDQGIEQVVAPIPDRQGRLHIEIENFSLTLYPYITGKTGMDTEMSDAHWQEFGAVLKQIHTTLLPTELLSQLQRETFMPKWSTISRELQAKINTGDYDHSSVTQKELAMFWQSRQAEIKRIVERTEDLGRLSAQTAGDFVLCHTDIHTANILLDEQEKLFIVDWDLPMLAPVERDLMFVMEASKDDGTTVSREEELFFRGYGETTVNPVAFAYYRYEWVVQEIGDYGERVFLMPDSGEQTKIDAVRGFQQLFDPGDVVEVAYRSETDLPPVLRHKKGPSF